MPISSARKQSLGENTFLNEFISGSSSSLDFRPTSSAGRTIQNQELADKLLAWVGKSRTSTPAAAPAAPEKEDVTSKAEAQIEKVSARQEPIASLLSLMAFSNFGDILGDAEAAGFLEAFTPKASKPAISQEDVQKLIQEQLSGLEANILSKVNKNKKPSLRRKRRDRDEARGQRGDVR